MRKIFSLFYIVFFSQLILAQEIAIGQWRVHLPYYKCISVALIKNKIYAATPTGLFYYDKSDNSIERISRVNGLSDLDINVICADVLRNQIIVGYKNGNIDIIKEDGKVVNFSDIKRKSISTDKIINNITINNSLAYFATGFGIVVFDLIKNEVKDTYLIGNNGGYLDIKEVAIFNNTIYAATVNGLYYADLNAPNVADFNYWTRVNSLPNGIFNSVISINDKVFANYSPFIQNVNNLIDKDTLYVLENNQWRVLNTTINVTAKRLQKLENTLVRVTIYNIGFYNLNGDYLYSYYNYNLQPPAPSQLITDNEGIIWIADLNNGLVKVESTGTFTSITPNGPSALNSSWFSSSDNGILYVAKGGVDDTWGNLFLSPEIYTFSNGEWGSINSTNDAGMVNKPDIITVAVNPNNNNELYAASYFNGLIKLENNKVVASYNETNSSLERNYRCGVAGIAIDNNNNVWVTNTISNKPLHVLKSDGTWKGFSLNGITNTVFIGRLVIDDFGKKWIQLPKGLGIYVYDDNNTIDDVSDDKQQLLNETIGKGGLHTTDIYALAKDLDGNIWVGTDKGITVFNNPGGVFTGANFDAQQIKIEQNGVVSYLLESEKITCIAVDYANRKWIGTSSAGVFLVSPDGTKEIKHFTTENSPLLSNAILSIGINNQTGEVFFGTEKGIISYKSDATKPTENYNNVYVYPNPVKAEYNGVIAIKNLVDNSIVKITDTQGNIVYETTSLGGQAIWDGKNFNKQKVSTGVYLVFSSSKNGELTNVTKILFIK